MIPIAWLPNLDPSLHGKQLQLELDVTNPFPPGSFPPCLVIGKYELCLMSIWGLNARKFWVVIMLLLACVFFATAWHHLSVVRRLRKKRCGDGILFLYTNWPVWSETFLRQDLQLLLDLKLPIHAVALFGGDCEPDPSWPAVEVLEPKRKSNGGKPGLTGKLVSFLPKELRAIGSLWRHQSLLRKVIRICRERKIGHIHAEFADLAALIASKASGVVNCSYSIGVHAADVHLCKYPPQSLFPHAAFVTACNLAVEHAVKKLYPPVAERVHMVPHGILLEEWPFGHTFPEKPSVLFVGRLVPKKGLSFLLEAMSHLVNNQMKEISLVVVGEGPLEQDMRALAEKLHLEKVVRWTGRLSHEEVRAEMQNATCLCVPSIVDRDGNQDGLPNVVTEAIALGLPVVGTQVGSLSDLLTLETGWPVAKRIPELLADAILDVASQPEERQRRSLNARHQLEYRYHARQLALLRAKLLRDARFFTPW
ncbi:MAG: glycosyltransferase [Victivallales bacterium]|nr:glycosyltransferase [Victivallales bacterium]